MTMFAVNLEKDGQTTCIEIINDDSENRDILSGKAISFMNNYVKKFIVQRNGIQHYEMTSGNKSLELIRDVVLHDMVNSIKCDCVDHFDISPIKELNDGYYTMISEDRTKLIVYQVRTIMRSGYVYNDVITQITKTLEMYSNVVGEIELLDLTRKYSYNDVVSELNAKLGEKIE